MQKIEAMEIRKNPEADLERRKSSFMIIGLLTALAITLVAFEWTAFEDGPDEMAKLDMEFLEEEVIPPSATPPPPPPPPPAPTTKIEIIEDEEEVEEVEVVDMEVTTETKVEPIQQRVEEVEEEQIFTIVEQMPSFPGGEQKLFEYLGKTIKYPQMATDAGISGVVYVTFVVGKDGKITDVKVLRGIGGGCDEEAIRVVKSMPPWQPGKQRGKPVTVQYNLPIRFTLR
jgi:protein TonB